MELTKLSKTDPTALELLRQLKSATTEEDKEKAKQYGKEYIQKTQTEEQPTNPTEEPTTEPTIQEEVVQEPVDSHESLDNDINPEPVPVVQKKEVEAKYDMSEPAFNPRLAKMGITREEELFQMHVYVRKLTREEKLEIRRSIYQKKKKYTKTTQETFRKQRAEKMAALQADPDYQKYQNQQRYVIKIEEALKNHCNIDWMLKNIEGLTVDIIRELLETRANVNRFNTQKDTFVPNFYKRFGK